MPYEPVIGLEIHAELLTRSKMFCACPVVDLTEAPPNSAVCPVCAGMPGTLPVLNARAVEYAVQVALALGCEINLTSIFARKNYFYPDLPKGYQISQYEQPLARNGRLTIRSASGERDVRIRRVHLEEDTGKSTHVPASDGSGEEAGEEAHSLIDLNRAGVPLLEIVTEPDLHSPEEVGAYARGLRQLLQYLGVNTGDMQKGVLRIEPNVSVRPAGSGPLGTRTEVKNLNSFRALERAVAFEIDRQAALLASGQPVVQETVGWDEAAQTTVPQRGKEEAHDYRYFPEPDLPPLTLDPAWVSALREALPELPHARLRRFQAEHGLSDYDAEVLTASRQVADYYEAVVSQGADPKAAANWITGELFGLLNQAGQGIEGAAVLPSELADLIARIERGEVSPSQARRALEVMFAEGRRAGDVIEALDLGQVSDPERISAWVRETLAGNPEAVREYAAGKQAVANWLFGQVMGLSKGRGNPQVIRAQLEKQLQDIIESQ